MSTIKTENGASSSFQLPINMSGTSASAASTTRHNVSVTNIKCEVDEVTTNGGGGGSVVPVIASTGPTAGYYNGGMGMAIGVGVGIRIPVTKSEEADSDSEAELTNIENLKVTRRATSSVDVSPSGAAGAAPSSGSLSKNGPRPMSWEGELSESETTETELMETDSNSLMSNGLDVGVAVIKSEATTTTPPALQLNHHLHLHNNNNNSSQHQAQPQPLPLTHPATTLKLDQEAGAAVEAPHVYSPHTKLKLGPSQSDPINLKYDPDGPSATGAVNSPLLARNKSTTLPLPANPSPDSAIHSVYTHSSPSQSPLTSRHAPYTPSLSRNNSDASHSSCYSYSSEFSPTHSPIQGRHAPTAGSGAAATPLYGSFNGSALPHHHHLYRPITAADSSTSSPSEAQNLSMDTQLPPLLGPEGLPASAAGISRQQLINSPCPICGDKISGFHYGIFSCESCKGFFKRTVQNRKNYVCVRGGPCPVSIATRKKCPACRFEKCLQKGMKLEAIREDRTRGGRSTYQCSYALPNSLLSPLLSPEQQGSPVSSHQQQQQQQRLGQQPPSHPGHQQHHGYTNGFAVGGGGGGAPQSLKSEPGSSSGGGGTRVPVLLQEIMDVEHLWQYNEAELGRLNQPLSASSSSSSTASSSASATPPGTTAPPANHMTNPLLASAGLSSNSENANPDLIAHLCNVADHRLYKIVKWCKSLPLFKNISIDDQICLLINSWCELLLFSCCFRSVDTPGEIKMSQGKKINLALAKSSGLQACIERMLNLTDHLRRLRVDRYEYVAMKVIVLLQSDTSELQEPVKVRECQEKALQSLQAYTLAHYPDAPSKFGELLLRIPDLQRTCQLGKEMLTIKSRDGGDFNLLMELLRGEH